MENLRLYVFIFWLVMLPAAFSQQNGVVEGRLLNRTDPSIVPANVEIEVIELSAGMDIIRIETTDSNGRFRIENLPEDKPLMIRAVYRGANYHIHISLNEDARANIDIEVFEPTTSMKDIEVVDARIAFQLEGDHLVSLETVSFNNKTNPPKTFTHPEGNFRISKSPGILEPPQLAITAPGTSMPVVQTALESPDGQSYYSLYPLRPGTTVFEVQQLLPYTNRSYQYIKKFYFDMGSMDIGVFPRDMVLSGQNLEKIAVGSQENFSVYMSPPIEAGTEVVWSFSGGTPVTETASSQRAGEFAIQAMPNFVGRNAFIIGPLLLMGFILVLWYAFNHPMQEAGKHDGVGLKVKGRKSKV
jgi:hypothetical protein